MVVFCVASHITTFQMIIPEGTETVIPKTECGKRPRAAESHIGLSLKWNVVYANSSWLPRVVGVWHSATFESNFWRIVCFHPSVVSTQNVNITWNSMSCFDLWQNYFHCIESRVVVHPGHNFKCKKKPRASELYLLTNSTQKKLVHSFPTSWSQGNPYQVTSPAIVTCVSQHKLEAIKICVS